MYNISVEIILSMPEFLLLIASSIILVVGLFTGRMAEPLTFFLSIITLIILAISIHFSSSSPDKFIFGEMYIDDSLAKTIKLFICLTVATVLLYARAYLQLRSQARPEFYLLALFATLGMLIMASAHNFVLIYLGLELLSLSMYTLVAYIRDSHDASEAAIKYFVLGAIASGMLLYGISIMYGLSGTLDLAALSNYLHDLEELNFWIGIGCSLD